MRKNLLIIGLFISLASISSCTIHGFGIKDKESNSDTETKWELRCHSEKGCNYGGDGESYAWDENCIKIQKRKILDDCYEDAVYKYDNDIIGYGPGSINDPDITREEAIKDMTETCYYQITDNSGGMRRFMDMRVIMISA